MSIKYLIIKIAIYEGEEIVAYRDEGVCVDNVTIFDDLKLAIEEHKRLEADKKDSSEWYEITIDYGQD